MKVVLLKYGDTESIHCYYLCPGCNYHHAFNPNIHKWNGDRERPTVSPSLLNSNPANYHTCHSFITDGNIQFCGDSWHDLKNKTVPLPDVDISKFDLSFITIIE